MSVTRSLQAQKLCDVHVRAAGGSRSRRKGGRSDSSRCIVIVKTKPQRILCSDLSQQQLRNGDAFLGSGQSFEGACYTAVVFSLRGASTRRTSTPYSLCQGHGELPAGGKGHHARALACASTSGRRRQAAADGKVKLQLEPNICKSRMQCEIQFMQCQIQVLPGPVCASKPQIHRPTTLTDWLGQRDCAALTKRMALALLCTADCSHSPSRVSSRSHIEQS